MSHFSEQTWADVARGFDREGRSEVAAHLASGCLECKSALELWERVVHLAAKENDYAPPENLVGVVKAEFSSSGTAEPQDWPIANLLFDTRSAPVQAGIRSGVAGARQLIYEGEGLTVDLRFERQPHSSKIWAAGQVLDKEVPLRWLGKATIVLWNDKGQMLSKSETGEYGEFQFEFEPQERLRITIATIDRRTLRIALGDMA